MKIVLDSNILISAYLFPGLARRSYEISSESHSTFISEFILGEVSRTLVKKFKIPTDLAHEAIGNLRSSFILTEPKGKPPTACRDPDDNHVLHLAQFTKSDIIITGDKDLTTLEKYKRINILTPRQFIEKHS